MHDLTLSFMRDCVCCLLVTREIVSEWAAGRKGAGRSGAGLFEVAVLPHLSISRATSITITITITSTVRRGEDKAQQPLAAIYRASTQSCSAISTLYAAGSLRLYSRQYWRHSVASLRRSDWLHRCCAFHSSAAVQAWPNIDRPHLSDRDSRRTKACAAPAPGSIVISAHLHLDISKAQTADLQRFQLQSLVYLVLGKRAVVVQGSSTPFVSTSRLNIPILRTTISAAYTRNDNGGRSNLKKQETYQSAGNLDLQALLNLWCWVGYTLGDIVDSTTSDAGATMMSHHDVDRTPIDSNSLTMANSNEHNVCTCSSRTGPSTRLPSHHRCTPTSHRHRTNLSQTSSSQLLLLFLLVCCIPFTAASKSIYMNAELVEVQARTESLGSTFARLARSGTILVDPGTPPVPDHWDQATNNDDELRRRAEPSYSTNSISSSATKAPSSKSTLAPTPTSSGIPSAAPLAASPLPTPFDVGFSSNITTTCAAFMKSMLSNQTFKSCLPFSLVLQVRLPPNSPKL